MQKLKSNGVGLLGAATLGVVMLSPAMTLYGLFGPSFLAAGKAAPLAFVWALIATIPTAISYVVLSRDYPFSGSASSWASLAFPKRVGVWAGWMVFAYYFTNFIIQPVTLGVFFGDLMKVGGISPSLFTFLGGVAICCAWPAWIVYRGISLSTKGALAFLLIEGAVVIGLCATVLFLAPSQGAQFSLENFQMSASPAGSSGVFRAMVFAMLAYCGFDVISTIAEETKMPKTLIPRATILSLVVYAVIVIGGIWCLTYGADTARLKEVAESGIMPITEVANRFWGKGALIVTITAISAALGLAIATSVGASRVLFSMGREGLAPKRFGTINEKYNVPWKAMNVIFLGGLGAAVLAGLLVGPYNAYVWWGTTSTFFAMITYLLVNLANMVLYRHKTMKSIGGFLLHGLIPAFAIVADGYILVRSFVIELWSQPWATGQSVLVFDIGCALAAVVAAILWKNTAAKTTVGVVSVQPAAFADAQAIPATTLLGAPGKTPQSGVEL